MVRGLTFNGKAGDAPNSYNDLTLGQFQDIYAKWELEKPVEERDFYKLFCILNPRFSEVKHSPENEEAVWILTSWVILEAIPYSKENILKMITIYGKQIELPEKIGQLSIIQNVVLIQLLEKAKYLEECLTMALAVYLQPLFDGKKFSLKRAQELEKLVRQLPASEVYGTAFFIVKSAQRNGTLPSSTLRPILNNLKLKLKRTLQPLLKFSGFLNSITCLSFSSMRQNLGSILTAFRPRQVLTLSSMHYGTIKNQTNTKNDFHIYGSR